MPPDPLDLVLFNQIYFIVLQCASCLEISSRSNKPLKMPSDSISEGLIFQNFLGGHAPRPPRFGMLCMPNRVLCTQLLCSLQCICAPPFCESWIRPWFSNILCNCWREVYTMQYGQHVIVGHL